MIFHNIIVVFFILLLIIFACSYLQNITINSDVKCIGKLYNRSCMYRNIYYYNRKWYIILNEDYKIKCVSYRSRSSNMCFRPHKITKKIRYNKIVKGISTYVSLFYTKNVGHLLFDDLYSIYLSLLKFNYKLNPFNIIISHTYSEWRNNRESDIFEKFSMKKLIYESDLRNKIVLFEKLIVGVAHHCQRCINKDYSIPGGKQYKATWWMRKRMYFVYNITHCVNKYSIIIHNKRFTSSEKNMLKKIIIKYESKNKIIYINWKKYPIFENQLKILSCTNMYISGPGTGLLNFPFMSDPGVIINLGTLFRGCPFYMEQYIEEGSMHYISLYYPSKKRVYGLREKEVFLLISKGLNILKNWDEEISHHICNLNIEALIFKNISNKKPEIMDRFLKERDWGSNKGYGVWAEKLIYFPNCYNTSYIVDLVLNETKEFKNELGCEISNSTNQCIYTSD